MSKRAITIILSVAICLIFLPVMLTYAFAWGTQSVDWSIMPEDGEKWRGERGWTIYVVRSGERIPLAGDLAGGYTGCEAGETIYLSRVWDADIENPVLRVHAVNACLAVWLDGEIVYTDVPTQYLTANEPTLPMLSFERSGPVEIPLYGDLRGETLTIALATPAVGEKPGYNQVYPPDVEVTTDFGYERGLISQSYRAGVVCALLAVSGLTVCAISVWRGEAGLLFLALLAFARMVARIASAEFFQRYAGVLTADIGSLADQISFSLTLAFLAAKCETGRRAMAGLAIAHVCSVVMSAAVQLSGWLNERLFFFAYLPDRLAAVFIVAALAVSVWEYKRKNAFFRVFLKCFAACLGAGIIASFARLARDPSALESFMTGNMLYARFFRESIIWTAQTAGLSAVAILAYKEAVANRERRVYDAVFSKSALSCYESLKKHQDEVMMLRHETVRHYAAIKGLVSEGEYARAESYMDDLLSREKQITRFINSGNELVNIILNSRVSSAESAGVRVEIGGMSVPEKLPVPDTDLVSLILNVVDNAVEAASETCEKLVRLDMHCKNDYFVFSCENSANADEKRPPAEGLNYGGYGLRIIERITAPYGNLVTAQRDGERYRVSVALPLNGAA